MIEEYRPVAGYEGLYEVSNFGNVKSLGGRCGSKIRIMKTVTTYQNYERLTLSKAGKVKNVSAHRLVAIAFIPNPDNKSSVNHIDGIRNNNKVDNLEWVTNSENIIHAYKVLNAKHGMTKLTIKDRINIKQEIRNGATIKQLADSYGVRKTTIQSVKDDKHCVRQLRAVGALDSQLAAVKQVYKGGK